MSEIIWMRDLRRTLWREHPNVLQATTATMRIRRLRCAHCGEAATGKQCRDRDTGYGVCPACLVRWPGKVGCADKGCKCDLPKIEREH